MTAAKTRRIARSEHSADDPGALVTGPSTHPRRQRGRGVRPWLLLPKLAGLALFIGGLAVLAAVALLGPEPQTLDGWRALRSVVRTVVRAAMLPGALLAIGCGIMLYAQHPGVFRRLRWFRVKLALLLIVTPVMHLWARGRVAAFDAALEAGRLDDLGPRFDAAGWSFAVTVVLYLGIAAIGRSKPRLGEPPGSRRTWSPP